ncbi:MAG TPA: 16S rRNA (adenine(1518)-N(6)/adenine(1519)-N(6))-dimethyltransferase RsmA [Candidatus Paceibacterota bacterium]|nr:16S rRNA (adenine(1518)-N(6)/adenine(1519)-N(6))-dimethyltransferase RsmA [Candidatus Paceibacterota bacterium]
MIRAKKSLGQNFLISPRIVGAIVDAANLKKGELAIEIGPGKGVLTKALLDAGARVKAIEKDDRLIPVLAESFRDDISRKNLELIHGDILETNIESLATGPESYKVIANIPYYVTGAIVRNFLSAKEKPSEMILMVQKEVADRVIARDGKESILSLSVKVYAKPELIMNVSRGNFFPIPNVDSAVIRLADIHNPFANKKSEENFFEIVRAGFAQKRKKLSSNLSSVREKETVAAAFKKLGMGENTRAEDVPLESWILLSEALLG